jgi:hypothetical protein
MTDPTKVRNQPALTTSTGKEWLIVGGLFAAISIAVLIALDSPAPAIAVGVLYLVMILTQLKAPKHKLRLLAAEMLLMAAIALGATLIVAANAA